MSRTLANPTGTPGLQWTCTCSSLRKLIGTGTTPGRRVKPIVSTIPTSSRSHSTCRDHGPQSNVNVRGPVVPAGRTLDPRPDCPRGVVEMPGERGALVARRRRVAVDDREQRPLLLEHLVEAFEHVAARHRRRRLVASECRFADSDTRGEAANALVATRRAKCHGKRGARRGRGLLPRSRRGPRT